MICMQCKQLSLRVITAVVLSLFISIFAPFTDKANASTSIEHIIINNDSLYLALVLSGNNVSISDSSIIMGVNDTLTVECDFKDFSLEYEVLWSEDWWKTQALTLYHNTIDIPKDYLGSNFAIPSEAEDPYLEVLDGIKRQFIANKTGDCTFHLIAHSSAPGGQYHTTLFDQIFTVHIVNEAAALPYLSIDAGHKDGLQADITGGRGMDINVSSNTNWNVTVTEGADWIAVSQKAGSGNGSFYTTISANSGPEREGWIEVSAPECETIRIRVMQEGVKELADAPKWKKETATVDSLDDVVAFVFQADDSAQYVQLLFEGYNEKNELVESGDLGIFPVRKTGGALSKFKYEIDSMKNFNNTVSKIWMYVCDAAGNALSKTSNPFVINQNNPQSLVPSGNQSFAAPKWAKDNYEIELGEKVPLHYTVDSTAKYVRLYYEVYDEAGQLLDMDSGIYDVTQSQTGSKSKYTVGSATINDHITKFLSILKEAIYNSKQYGIEPNKNLIVAIDQLIKEYKDMKATALEYFIKYVVSTGIDKGLGAALPPVAVYNGIIQTTGGVLSMAGIYDDSEARMFVTYSEGSVFQMLLGGLGEIEYQISKGKGDEIKKSDFEKYKKVALYCYQARLDQIDKLISSGAVSGNDKSNLTRIRQEIEKGMSNIKNEKLCVVN